MFGETITVNVAVVAHWPAVGVKTYVPELVLSTTEGVHMPVTPSIDVPINEGTDPPSQIDSIVPKLNVGVIFGVTVTGRVVVTPHVLPSGVNV